MQKYATGAAGSGESGSAKVTLFLFRSGRHVGHERSAVHTLVGRLASALWQQQVKLDRASWSSII
jgi:hypothetical protein